MFQIQTTTTRRILILKKEKSPSKKKEILREIKQEPTKYEA